MSISGADVDRVRLVPDTVWIKGAKEVFLFNIERLTLKWASGKAENWKEGIKMELVLKRGPTAEIMQTYIPSLGLLLCTFLTTKFKLEYFGDNVGVNLTLMLLIFTMFTAKFAELPRPSTSS